MTPEEKIETLFESNKILNDKIKELELVVKSYQGEDLYIRSEGGYRHFQQHKQIQNMFK